jgi:DnaJ-class molecular chaperone
MPCFIVIATWKIINYYLKRDPIDCIHLHHVQGRCAMHKDYYVVLGVSRGADLHKIKKAYRMVVKKYHPDMGPSREDSERFLEVKKAYETLSDEEKRRRYDQKLARQGSQLKAPQASGLIRRRRAPLEDLDPLASAADEFFGGFVPGFLPDYFEKEHGKGKDLFLDIILTPQEAFAGGLFPMAVPVIEDCPRCRRTGMWEEFYCPVCRGKGRVQGRREFSLSIPPHVLHGTDIRLPLDDIGLANVYLNVSVLVEPYLGPEW